DGELGNRPHELLRAVQRIDDPYSSLREPVRRVTRLLRKPAIVWKGLGDRVAQSLVGARVGNCERTVAAVPLLDGRQSGPVQGTNDGARPASGLDREIELLHGAFRSTLRYSTASDSRISSRRSYRRFGFRGGHVASA